MGKIWRIQCPWCTARGEFKAEKAPTVCDKCGRFVLVNPVPLDDGACDANIGTDERLDERYGCERTATTSKAIHPAVIQDI